MTFLELAKKRHSCRKFCTKKVEEEKLMQILEAARVAPTAVNKQPARLLVIQGADGLAKLGKTADVYNAPLVILVCGEPEKAWERPFDKKNVLDVDLAIVTDHMMLTATDLGLNSLWVCYFDPAVLKKEFNIPANYVVLNALAIGYGNGTPASPDRHDEKRKPLESFVFYETM